MDSSDGLSTTLNEMSKQSKKKFVINNIPYMKDLRDFAESQKLDLNDLIFMEVKNMNLYLPYHPNTNK